MIALLLAVQHETEATLTTKPIAATTAIVSRVRFDRRA